jgi:hypothetical protein
MRKPLLYAVLLALALWEPMGAHGHVPPDVFAAFATAWGKHNAEAMSAFWVEEGQLFYPYSTPDATLARKQNDVRTLLEAAHSGIMNKSTYVPDEKSFQVRPLGKEFLLVDFEADIIGAAGTSGPLRHRVSAVMRLKPHQGDKKDEKKDEKKDDKKSDHTTDLAIVSMAMLPKDPPASLKPGPQ